MQISAWKYRCRSEAAPKPKGIVGLNVGEVNRREHFGNLLEVDVEIDGTFRHFILNTLFWISCPEIRDEKNSTIIRDWLARRGALVWKKGFPPKFTLEPLGNGRFRLVSE